MREKNKETDRHGERTRRPQRERETETERVDAFLILGGEGARNDCAVEKSSATTERERALRTS